jgi:hypothetical protein
MVRFRRRGEAAQAAGTSFEAEHTLQFGIEAKEAPVVKDKSEGRLRMSD